MPRLYAWSIALLVVAAAACAVWVWQAQQQSMPTLSVTAPLSGAIVYNGATTTIAWSTRGVPAAYRVAITIRRIPPPPLPSEGQEFDPIIFTDLPNTGQVEWRVADMYPPGNYVVEASAYRSVPVTDPVSGESAPFRIEPGPLPAEQRSPTK